MTTITAASIVLTITVDSYSPAPQTIQGFSPDNVTDGEAQTIAEGMMGVDGYFTAGFYNVPFVQTIELMGDSPSCAFFDGWYAAQQVLNGGAGDILYATTGIIMYPGLGKKITASKGVLTSYKPVPAGQRLLRPRPFTITWGQRTPLTLV